MDDSKIFITGAGGQLGTALRKQYPKARFASKDELDITDRLSVEKFDWSSVEVILNAAAYTNVDGAETDEGRVSAWQVNAEAVASLARVARQHDMTLIHFSSDYVFDGNTTPHAEDEPFSPLSIYGASKAAGDIVVSLVDKHYILRTTWVVGEGKNFVRTMLSLAEKGIKPTVVSDQVGRLTFTSELARAADHLLASVANYGIYNVTNDGPAVSWADIAKMVFELSGKSSDDITPVTTAQYYEGKTGIAPRPLQSTLNLDKIHATGFVSNNWVDDLKDYVNRS